MNVLRNLKNVHHNIAPKRQVCNHCCY